MEINEVMETLSTVGSAAVWEYTKWFFVSTIFWLIACGIAFRYILKIDGKAVDEALDSSSGLGVTLKCVSLTMIAIIFLVHVPDLFAPQAAAIHQILTDIRR